MTEERAIFRPKGYRPPRDEQWEMKQAVIARDGLTDCFWCRQPFLSVEDATLEHILPLFDGGRHDLRNCTLSCIACNNRNVPRAVVDDQTQAKITKAVNTAVNRSCEFEDCDALVSARFEAIARERRSKMLKYADASFFLKQIHRQLGRLPPSGHEKHRFKAHFNRWLSNATTQ